MHVRVLLTRQAARISVNNAVSCVEEDPPCKSESLQHVLALMRFLLDLLVIYLASNWSSNKAGPIERGAKVCQRQSGCYAYRSQHIAIHGEQGSLPKSISTQSDCASPRESKICYHLKGREGPNNNQKKNVMSDNDGALKLRGGGIKCRWCAFRRRVW